MDRSEKELLVSELRETFEQSSIVVVTKQSGLTVSETENLRGIMRDNGAGFRIAKNRLAKLAMKDTPFESLSEYMTGTTALAYSEDAIAAAKAANEFASDNKKLEILGGVLDGKALSAAEVNALAKLPSLDQLRGKLVGLVNAPASKIVGVTAAPASQLARVIAAYSTKDAA